MAVAAKRARTSLYCILKVFLLLFLLLWDSEEEYIKYGVNVQMFKWCKLKTGCDERV